MTWSSMLGAPTGAIGVKPGGLRSGSEEEDMMHVGSRACELDIALERYASGEPVVVLDDGGSGDFVAAADVISTEVMARFIRLGSGFVQVALPGTTCDRLWLPPMPCPDPAGPYGWQCVGVDAAVGITTGISAVDRAHTARLLADPDTGQDDLVRPGHVIPLRTRPDSHAGVAESAVALSMLAGRAPAAVICSIVSPRDPLRMADADDLVFLAGTYDLPIIDGAGLPLVRPSLAGV
ncbi:MAG: 3,4-dihydroxy-2-butanone-4-phosphate synthase [Rhodococcus sp. (in: high G+C Gram-positive bacteria)]